MLLCHAIDRDRSTHLSCQCLLHGFALIGKRRHRPRAQPLISMPSARWRPMLSLSLVGRVAGGRHKDRRGRRLAPLEVQLEAPYYCYYYAHLSHPLTDAANLTTSTNCRPRMYCNPYCNRADTHWYTMDKSTPSDHRKCPKQARFPDAQGRARMYASKLVAGAGKRFESARRLFILLRFAGKT
jgi:hypothetical protein